jgi:hypothetical protein
MFRHPVNLSIAQITPDRAINLSFCTFDLARVYRAKIYSHCPGVLCFLRDLPISHALKNQRIKFSLERWLRYCTRHAKFILLLLSAFLDNDGAKVECPWR